jgi:hypothetical protein
MPGLDFELTQRGEVTFGVSVCHGPFLRHVCAAVRQAGVPEPAEGPVSRPMARARCTASPRLGAPSLRCGRDRSEHPRRERIGNEEVPSALIRLGSAGPTVSEYSPLATEIPASVVMFGGSAVIAPPIRSVPAASASGAAPALLARLVADSQSSCREGALASVTAQRDCPVGA